VTISSVWTRSGSVLPWWLAAAIAGLCVAATVVSPDPEHLSWRLVLLPALWGIPGALIAAGRPRNPLGWLMLAVAGGFAGIALATEWLIGGRAVGADWAAWFADRAAAYLVPCALAALLLLPDGRLPSRRWRPVVAAVLVCQLLLVIVWSLTRGPAAAPDTSLAVSPGLANPVGLLPASWGAAVARFGDWVLQAPMLLAVVAVVDRLRRSPDGERHRLVSVLMAAVVFVLLVVGGGYLWPVASDVLDVAGSAMLAAAVTAAVLRRRMREVEVVVSHAFVHGVLTVVIALGYVATVAVVGRFGASTTGIGLVTGVIALALLPLRGLMQRAVDRVMYGDTRRPHAALRRLTDSVGEATTLDAVMVGLAQATAASLRASWVEVAAAETTATVGARSSGPSVHLALALGERGVGALTVGFRRGRRVGSRERALLQELAEHGARAIQAVQVADALQANRQLLVTAREEERSRLRRDLHDELGPTLAGLAMQLGSLAEVVRADPAIAVKRLARLEAASRAALDDVRRVSRGLRPPELDELGLVGALEQTAREAGLRLTIDLPEPLPVLPPAAEVAAYRIAAEALVNVARHAGVTSACLSLGVANETLAVRVVDAGVGFPTRSAQSTIGVGTVAMRERAEELGGTLVIGRASTGGTVVEARLPAGTASVLVAPLSQAPQP
jgi:two-component system NarL family sensor kinase